MVKVVKVDFLPRISNIKKTIIEFLKKRNQMDKVNKIKKKIKRIKKEKPVERIDALRLIRIFGGKESF